MSEHIAPPISRRSVLGAGTAAAAVAAGLPFSSRTSGRSSDAGRPPGTGIANVHVTHDHYGVHVEPSVAANPRHPRQLLAACQASPTANPQLIALDAGATWENGARPQPPAGTWLSFDTRPEPSPVTYHFPGLPALDDDQILHRLLICAAILADDEQLASRKLLRQIRG